MRKNNDPSSEAAVLCYDAFHRDLIPLKHRPADEQDTCTVTEFGVSARSALTNDVLTRKIGDETQANGNRTAVYACYNWKLRLPFLIVRRELENTRSEYSPQYGRDDNYVTYKWTNTVYAFYSLDECATREPEVAQLLTQLE